MTDDTPGAGARITLDELHRKMADLSLEDRDLARYLLTEDSGFAAAAPRLRLNPATVEIPPDLEGQTRSAALLNGANFLARLRREARFKARVDAGYEGPLLAAEGDSWFQYPFRLMDVIDWMFAAYPVYCRSEAGDTLENMLRRGEFLTALDHTGGQILLLSGGGNDLVAGGNLAAHLRPFDPGLAPAQYLLPSFGAVLDQAIANIEKIARAAGRAFPHCRVVCHGYDYTLPADGPWLGRPMAAQGIAEPGLQKAIAREMVDRLNTRLLALARQTPRIAFVDCRGAVGDGAWYDELHPTDEGYRRVAERLRDRVARILPAPGEVATRSLSPSAGAQLRTRGRAAAPTRPAAAAARGLALHVGVNALDPAAYEGWTGALVACEYDAEDMAALAAAVGYAGTTLLTAAATREAVIGAIASAAEEMRPGDIFLFTYSGHGGQVPDFNGDEGSLPGEEPLDETLCLHDGQIVDDELYELWSRFPADSRILVISDCCHSGTNVRARLVDEAVALPGAPRPRAMPRGVAARVARRQRAFYEEISRRVTTRSGGPATREMAMPVQASVRLLSACQDNQLALDGMMNGLFTGKLLEAWGAGAFPGDYDRFVRAIAAQMPPDQRPNHYRTGLPSPAYDAQRPFDI